MVLEPSCLRSDCKEYDSFMSDSKADKAAKSAAREHKAAKKQGESASLTEKKNDLQGTQKDCFISTPLWKPRSRKLSK